MKKIIIIAHYGKSITNLRGDLIKDWIKEGYEVLALAPEEDVRTEVEELGCRYLTYKLDRTGNSIIQDLKTVSELRKIIRKEKPSVVFTYAAKPNIYGSLAARIEGVDSIFSMINGAGYLFSGEKKSFLNRCIGRMIKKLYRFAVYKNQAIFFQNTEDRETFEREGILSKNTKAVRIDGSGVNMDRFKPLPKLSEDVIFLMVSRLLWDKGISQYVSAAKDLKKEYPKVRFQILGPFDTNPQAISQRDIQKWVDEGTIEYLGETSDVRPYLKEASVFVLPTYYREGIPRSILEAMSMAKPIITTHIAGCKETVRPGINGFLVAPKDAEALRKAMQACICEKHRLEEMGKASRQSVKERFDVSIINGIILEETCKK